MRFVYLAISILFAFSIGFTFGMHGVLIVGLIMICASFLTLLRNEWVFKHRIDIIKNRFNEYDNYLDYNQMMLRFWIWDIEKLRIPESDSQSQSPSDPTINDNSDSQP